VGGDRARRVWRQFRGLTGRTAPAPPTADAPPAAANAGPRFATRREALLSLFDPTGRGLEIGPSYNPLLPKAEGFRVETVDYADQATLRAKYARTGNVDIARIEAVDHVTGGAPMSATIKERGCYDFIVASHVIEHTPDLIGFVEDCALLLKPDGVLALAVPDKRFCFDLLQPITFAGAVLLAHEEKRTRPTAATVFDSVAYDVLRGGAIGWGEGETAPPTFAASIEAARGVAEAARQPGAYVDVHVWRFTPASFRLLIEDLHGIGALSLREKAIIPGQGNEFFAALSRDGAGPGLMRDELGAQMLRDLAMALPSP